MDTRTKIVSAVEAMRMAEAGALVVSGYFDPLLAAHAERLRGLKREGAALIVAISEPQDPILPARARAELLAGLAVVDRVVESAEGLKIDVHLEAEDAHRLDSLIEHVHARSLAGKTQR